MEYRPEVMTSSKTKNTENLAGAGIYIHIPFCRQKCHYCNFYSSASSKYRKELIQAIAAELIFQQNYLGSANIETIYFGGGTPSLLDYDEYSFLLNAIFNHFPVSPLAELTFEANPDDLDHLKIRELSKSPVNRLSIGIQSFCESDLKYLNRVHSFKQAEYAIKASQDAGFENISIDLIYGIPTLSDENWQVNLRKAISFQIPHISAYALTVEKNTALEKLIQKKGRNDIDETTQVKHFEMAMDSLKNHDYIHYEISNFCKEGFYSKHNSNYWKGIHYLGVGPSAHSFNGVSRQWNVSSIDKYIHALANKTILSEKEDITLTMKYNEYVLTRLRTIWGCDDNYIKNEFGNEYQLHFSTEILPHLNAKHVAFENGLYTLTNKGKIIADKITADLFFD